MIPISPPLITDHRNFDSNVLTIILRTYNGRIWLWWNSSKCLKRHHKCRNVTTNVSNRLQTSFSHFWSTKSPNSWKMRPHSGSYFLYCPQIRHLLVRIDYNQRKLSRNDPKSSNFRLQSTQIVTQSSPMPQMIQNSSQIGQNSSQNDSNCVVCL